MNTQSRRLSEVRSKGFSLLNSIDEVQASRKQSPDKWSVKEITGHLIDSACNNHRRIVLAQKSATLVFDGYDQEEWVRVQQYQTMEWQKIISLWSHYNELLAFIISGIPEEILQKQVSIHNFDQIAFNPIEKNSPATLSFLISDYTDHLIHHLNQIENY